MKVDLVGNIWYKVFHYCICIMHIYILRMHTLIHMGRVSIIKLFLKTPIILLEGIKIFNDKIARKLPLVILTNWSSERFKGIWSS